MLRVAAWQRQEQPHWKKGGPVSWRLGKGRPAAVRPQLTALEARKRALEADRAIASRDVTVDLHPNLPELYRRKFFEALTQILADEAAQPQAKEIIRSLIERIEVHSAEKRGECEVVTD